MESATEAEYAAFVEKVKRTVYLDNLSPQVTESVVRTACDQFGNVKSVSFIPNYIGPGNMPNRALVEMEDAKQARQVVSQLCAYPFMMSGMPRPVRARHAEVEMLDERPKEPGRRISFQWLKPTDPNFETAERLKCLFWKHDAESSFLPKQQLDQEEKLAKQQGQYLKSNYKKLEMIDDIIKRIRPLVFQWMLIKHLGHLDEFGNGGLRGMLAYDLCPLIFAAYFIHGKCFVC